jgi:hypothetical protein
MIEKMNYLADNKPPNIPVHLSEEEFSIRP